MKSHRLAAQCLSTRRAEDVWAAALLALTAQASGAEATLVDKAKQYFSPLPQDMATAEFPTPAPRVELGKKLFFDPRLSTDGTVACATCHRPALYGTDALPKSIGVEHRMNARNAPTVLNAALHFKAHWIGDRTNVEEQAMKSLSGQASFGNPDNAAVIRKIKALPGYAEEFAQAFPDEKEPVQPENWGKAIGAYERTLVTPIALRCLPQGGCQSPYISGPRRLKASSMWVASPATTAWPSAAPRFGSSGLWAIPGRRLRVSRSTRGGTGNPGPGGQVCLQGPEPAQREHDPALFP
ncbi:MAG: cytochrome-c peroxidase [Pseudomonadota bacterium]|nr:cytochrome-c peroxidase [Pseudomonadota bacterium]